MTATPVEPGRDIPVTLRCFGGRSSPGKMDVRAVGPAVRAARGLRALAWCWAFALIAVLVPFLHWVLVPVLVALGPLLALRAMGFDRQVTGGGGTCPACGSAVAFTRAVHPEAFTATCPVCRLGLDVGPVDG
jgi:hypothetical protein